MYFRVNFVKSLRTTFVKEHRRWLLLKKRFFFKNACIKSFIFFVQEEPQEIFCQKSYFQMICYIPKFWFIKISTISTWLFHSGARLLFLDHGVAVEVQKHLPRNDLLVIRKQQFTFVIKTSCSKDFVKLLGNVRGRLVSMERTTDVFL